MISPAFSQKNTPIVFSSDKNYFPYFLVALESIIQNSSMENNYDILLLSTDLTKEDLTLAHKQIQCQKNISIRLIDVSDLAEKYHLDTLITMNHIRVSAYYRLLISEILPLYHKIIYLDCDLIIVKDIANLFKTDIADNYLGAVIDKGVQNYFLPHVPEFKKYMQSLGMQHVENYFNSGVLIMNLEAIRKESLIDQFIQIAQKNNQFFHDQNVLNAVCDGKVFFLESQWNIQCCDKIKDKNFGIIHYCGDKPWNKKGVHLAKYWWKYAQNTFHYEKILTHYKENFPKNRKTNFKKLEYKILYKLCFGQMRQKYRLKYKEIK